MTEAEYRAAEGINKSTLWEMRKSPAHYKWILEHPPEDTAAFKFGRALHAAVLTPRIFKRDFRVAPQVDRRTKAGKDAYAEWLAQLPPGAEVLTAEDLETIQAMVQSLKATPDAVELLHGTRKEKPLFWREGGLKCKCRLDAWGPDRVVDLKTTSDMGTFQRDARRYGYHVQAAHYLSGVAAKTGKVATWYFLAIEKSPPYGVKIFRADPAFIDEGEFIRQQLLERVAECMRTGIWPCYETETLKGEDTL